MKVGEAKDIRLIGVYPPIGRPEKNLLSLNKNVSSREDGHKHDCVQPV